jgi:hypothetical protein
MDSFLSMSMFATPKNGDIDYLLKRISSTMTFLNDDSLKLSLSFMRTTGQLNLNMDGTRWTTNISKLLLPSDILLSDSTDDMFDVKLEKDIRYKNNHIISGAQYVKKKFNVESAYNNGVKDDNPDFVDVGIISAYIQDDYLINTNQMLTASAKINIYDSKSKQEVKKFYTLQARLGYIVTTKTDALKFFISRMQLPTEQYVLTSTDLKKIEILNITDCLAEYSKKIGAHTVGIIYEFIQNDNSVLLRANGAPKRFNNYSASLKYAYNFNEFNSLKSMFYRNEYYNRVSIKKEIAEGGFVRLLNSWKKVDIYNEADYYHIKDSQISGINYNFGLRYKATETLIFSAKGTNVFNSAAKSRYSYVKMNGFIPEQKSLYYSPIDRSFIIGMEYNF